ncbi:endolytic transglycosylase MltG [Aureibaculum sp. A20]|uniref:Endolytic murein transglycosylase n=1 Tax=Aureibaculum flavum TaxID=2795986 RepID=A0ABS0WTZ7_9FLAO|nr:endolytic transglycosylase MltG [Aureibaculum flavum]MBJ2175323.1 endolytic transglycosylase MltG [Aureibaculum flavum]
MKLKKIILAIIAILLIGGGLIAYQFYGKIYSTNVKEDTAIFIPTNATFDEVKEVLSPVVSNIDSFVWVANQKNYPNVIKSGKYLIKKGMSNNALIDLLRSGKQTPLTLTFNNQDTLEKLAGRIAAQIEPDSLQILTALTDSKFLAENNFTKATVLGLFIPNSYEFYWNTSVENFRNKMLKEYDRFWNTDRIAKAKKLNMSKNNVITLASIVQKETAKVSERPTVAGLYLNRYRDGWALQADPTVIFALKQKHGQDYEVKRVLNADLLIDSPYNTYKNTGLPPAPIAMPDISSIDAVLNSENHEYYYMCASISNIGSHEFARTLSQHNLNAKKYQQWLNKQGVNR